MAQTALQQTRRRGSPSQARSFIALLENGAGVREVQQLLGHAKISTTQRYTNVIPIELKKVHAASHLSEHQRTPAAATPMRSRGSKWDALRRSDE